MIRISLLLLSGVAFLSCQGPRTGESPIPIAIGTAMSPFPRSPLPPEETALFRSAKTLDDLYTIERAVKFDEKINLGRLGKVRYHKDKLLVLDTLQDAVHLFTSQGAHLRTIGKRGQGPGEYGTPVNIYIDQDQIAIVDSGEHRILFYDFEGNFTREIKAGNTYFHIYLPDHVIFEGDYIYLCDFPARKQNVPRIVALDRSQNPAVPVFGFGERLPFYFTSIGKKMPRYRTEIFREVNGTIWTIPLFQTDIEIYDLNGHKLGSLPSGIDGITPEIVEKVKNTKDHIETTSLTRSFNLLHHENIVIVQYIMPFSANIYDTNGNLLRKGMSATSMLYTGAIGLENGRLLSRVDSLAEPELVEKNLGRDALNAFLEAGYNPESFLDDNPYLVLSKTNW